MTSAEMDENWESFHSESDKEKELYSLNLDLN